MTDKIRMLEESLLEAEKKVSALLREGKIPTSTDYVDVDQIKKELKVARRMIAMDSSRTEPKLTRKISILLTEDEFEKLSEESKKEGVVLSKYIRKLVKNGLKSGG